MEDEVIHIEVGLCLGVPLCEIHSFCGGHVDKFGIHGLKWRYSKGRHSRHADNIINTCRSLESIKVSSHLKPLGIIRVNIQWE